LPLAASRSLNAVSEREAASGKTLEREAASGKTL
jgi:hypothetical protein